MANNEKGEPPAAQLPPLFAARYSLLALPVPPFRRGGAAGKTNWQAFQGVRIGYHVAWEQPLGLRRL